MRQDMQLLSKKLFFGSGGEPCERGGVNLGVCKQSRAIWEWGDVAQKGED